VLSRPAAFSTASAPVPFWSPTFSVTEDRLTAELEEGEADDVAAAAAEDDDELLDDEHPAAASPARATTEQTTSLGL
jgi:hypothetical protein